MLAYTKGGWHNHGILRYFLQLNGTRVDILMFCSAKSSYVQCVIDYTMPTRAIWDLLPEPEGEGNKSHVARGGVV